MHFERGNAFQKCIKLHFYQNLHLLPEVGEKGIYLSKF